MKKQKKTMLDLMQEVRGTWSINPRTRIHDNAIKRDRKKIRQEGKKASREAFKGTSPKAFNFSYYSAA